MRGFLDAYDAETGELAWRWWAVPAPGEPGGDTWEGDSWKTGGGATWLTGSYDPELGLLYWGIGNPAPDWNGDVRPGDNLYTCSLVALDVNTGELRWHFQFTPHDTHDWDANQIPVLVDAEWDGEMRKLVILANRNAFYYVLDRETGQFLRATQYATQTWAEGIDENGRPVLIPGMDPSEEGTLVWPSLAGSTNWYSPAYDPDRQSLFVPTREMASWYFKSDAEYEPGTPFLGGGERSPRRRGRLRGRPGARRADRGTQVGVPAALAGGVRGAGDGDRAGGQRHRRGECVRAGRRYRRGALGLLRRRRGAGGADELRPRRGAVHLGGRRAVHLHLRARTRRVGGGGRRGERGPVRRAAALALPAALWALAAGCGGPEENRAETAPAAGPLLLVTNEDGGTLGVISLETRELVAEIEVGRRPRGVRVSPDGAFAYVAVSGSPKCPPWMDEDDCAEPDKSFDGIAEVDLRARTRTRLLPGGSDPESFDITPDGARLVVSNEDSDEASLVDLASGAIIRTVPVGKEPEGVRISPDGTVAYVTGETDHDVTVLDTATGDEITRIPVGHRPRDVVFTPDGAFAYVSAEIAGTVSEIVVAENRVARTFHLPMDSRSMGVALSPDAGTLYVSNGRAKTVSVVDLASGEVVGNVEAGERLWGIAVSFDGRFLYTADGPSNDIAVLETETLTIVARIPVGESPWGLALVP